MSYQTGVRVFAACLSCKEARWMDAAELPEFLRRHRCHDVVSIEYGKLTIEQEFEAWFKNVMGW